MSTQIKLPEIKKEAFQRARENLGLSTKDLSVMACLSVRQIEQLESGESGSFYGPQIKLTAAKKVAGLLKLSEEDAFDFAGVAPEEKIAPENMVEQTKPVVVPEEKKSKPAKPVEDKIPEEKIEPQQTISVHEQNSESSNVVTVEASAKNPKKKLFVLLSIAVAITFSVVNLRPLFFPEVVREEIVVIQETPANPASEATTDTKPIAPLTPEPTVTAAPVAASAPAVSAECPPIESAVVNYKVDAPRKAGDMVYMQSKTAQTVCVIDASGKTQNKTLEPGVGVSIYGKPPLKVLTSGQTPVDMYYQGARVRLSNITAKTIVLEPAEITQPASPTDTQPR